MKVKLALVALIALLIWMGRNAPANLHHFVHWLGAVLTWIASGLSGFLGSLLRYERGSTDV